MRVDAVRVAGRTRSNVTIVEPGGVTTKLNEPGGPLSAAELDEIAAAVEAAAAGASWVVGCGSLPPGRARRHLRRAVPQLRGRRHPRRGRHQRPGPARRGRGGPDLIKPNREELAEAVGAPGRQRSPTSSRPRGELRDRAPARSWPASAPRAPCSSTTTASCTGEAPVARPRSTVGAGDALLAGFLAAGRPRPRRPRRGARLGRRGRAPARQPDAGPGRHPAGHRPHPPAAGPRPGRSSPDPPDPSADPSADRSPEPSASDPPRTSAPRSTRPRWPPLHPRAHGNRVQGPDPAVRRQPGRDGHAEHRRVHRLGPDHRVVHPDRLAAQRGRWPRSSTR